ncbi:hypothetical protein ABIE58_002760 [Roseovarius sp. MBR-78]|jgi:hypothetical protein
MTEVTNVGIGTLNTKNAPAQINKNPTSKMPCAWLPV